MSTPRTLGTPTHDDTDSASPLWSWLNKYRVESGPVSLRDQMGRTWWLPASALDECRQRVKAEEQRTGEKLCSGDDRDPLVHVVYGGCDTTTADPADYASTRFSTCSGVTGITSALLQPALEQYSPPSPVPPITLTQAFSRRAVGYLWGLRKELDPGQVANLNALFNNRQRGRLAGEQSITYRLSKSKAGELGWGRLYGDRGSLETLERECRGTVCREFYNDVDLVNCHPVLLVQFARRYLGLTLTHWEGYVADRGFLLAQTGLCQDEAKTAVIKVLYGGKGGPPCLEPLRHEMKLVTSVLGMKAVFKPLLQLAEREAKREGKSKWGSFLAYVLQTEERHVCLALVDSLRAQRYQVDVLAYDGVMVRKQADRPLTDVHLRAAEAAILAATGYRVALLDKPMEAFEMPPEGAEDVVEGVSRSDYEAMRARFEETHFYYSPSNTFAEVDLRSGDIQFMEERHARTALSTTWLFELSDRFADNVAFFDVWKRDPLRRVVRRLSLRPSDDPQTYWPPAAFAYQAAPRASALHERMEQLAQGHWRVGLFRNFVDRLVPDREMHATLLQWLAQLVQDPYVSSRACVILTGGKGCGKDTLGDFVMHHLLGPRYCANYTSNVQFWDKHDVARLNKLFVKVEEASGRQNEEHAEEMKTRVTGVDASVNPKNKDAITYENLTRYLMTTNDPNPVALDEDERRFLVMSCSRAWTGNMPFFKALREGLFCADGGRAVADWLRTVDAGSWPRVLPKSAAAREMIEAQRTVEQRFVEAWSGEETGMGGLWIAYESFCAVNGLKGATTSRSLGMRLLEPLRDGVISRRMLHGVSMYAKA